jgi:hypothetical protein
LRSVSITPCRVTPPLGARGPAYDSEYYTPLRLAMWHALVGTRGLDLHQSVPITCFSPFARHFLLHNRRHPEAVLPDRALRLPTFSHLVIVNKLLSLSPPSPHWVVGTMVLDMENPPNFLCAASI